MRLLKYISKNRVSVDKYERNSVLTVRKAVRADSGKYRITLKNTSGTCEGIADVVVLGESIRLLILLDHMISPLMRNTHGEL